MATRYLKDKLARHGITTRDADFVLRSEISVWEDMGPSVRRNDRIVFVGFDSSARLLEIAVEYFDDKDIELIFHGNDASPKHRKLFERMRI